MLAALIDYGSRLLHRWWIYFSGVFGGLGVVKEMGVLPNVPFSSWVWWTLATATLVGAQFSVFYELWRELKARKDDDLFRNMKFEDVVTRIVGPHSMSSGQGTKIIEAFDQITQQAVLGRLKSWGQRGIFLGGGGTGPLLEIPKIHWEKYPIDYLDYWKYGGKIGPPNNHDETYETLTFNDSQVDLIWPKKKPARRMRFQWPVHLYRQ